MAITVRDALQIGELVRAKVLAGSNGLDNEIRFVDIIDVPDAAIWFRRDSLLSTTFYALKDDIEAQLQVLDDIKACGGSGLIIFSPERYITQIDERLMQKADQLNLPLLQMPDCSYIDVIVPVMSEILDKQVKALEYAQNVHSMMTNMVLKGEGLQELLSSLSVLLKKPVLLADESLHLLNAAVYPEDKVSSPLLMEWQNRGSQLPITDFYPRNLLSKLIYNKVPAKHIHDSDQSGYFDFLFPVVAGENCYGVLIVPDLETELSKAKTVALEAGAMAIALDILKNKAVAETERKNQLDFYNELLLGNIKNRENIISRARKFGLDATGSYYVLLAELDKEHIYHIKSEQQDPKYKTELENKLLHLLNYSLMKENVRGVVVETLGSLVALIRVPDALTREAALRYGKEIMNKIRENVQQSLEGIPVYMAIGDYCEDIDRISAGYMEAWETIDIGKKIYSVDFALTHSEMAPYHIVKRFLSNSDSSKLYEYIFEPLLSYDREKGGELVQTLETYVECNFSRTKTAEKMHLHRNSLNYRLQKIEELLGQDISMLDTFPLLLASISRRISQ